MAPHRSRPGRPFRGLVVVSTVLGIVGCSGSGASGAAPCEEPVQEPLDPGTLLHVLPDVDVTYATDPPTSGPHVGVAPEGVSDRALPGPVQVAVLERGDVLVQYDEALPQDQVGFLLPLAGEDVVVAPGDGLPAPVVATAWTWKLVCTAVDLDALDRFVADHAGLVEGHG